MPITSAAMLISFAAGCAARPDAAPEGSVARIIAESADRNHVPRDLMVAVAHVEGGLRLGMHRDVHDDDAVPVAGVLELRHGRFNSLARGAALMGATEVDLMRDLAQGTEAGARVLDELGRGEGATEGRLASYAPVVEELSGHVAARDRADYRARVFRLLRSGGEVPARGGEVISIPPHEEIPIELTFAPPPRTALGTPEYPSAIWFDTPENNKWTPGREGNAITMIAIHDTEGGWDASVATLQNDGGKSVHYIVDADGSRVGQFIYEADTGWHVGNWYYNLRMVGIEHVGYAADDAYQTPMYEKSADLVRSIAKRNKLGPNGDGTHLTRKEIVAHQEVPDGNVIPQDSPPCPDSPGTCVKSAKYGGASNHRDPGVNWEWCQYMELIGDGASCKCNDAFEHFNCVHDGSEMVRCPNGVVEIEHCPGGCIVEPLGVDDQCMAVMSTSTGAGAGGAGGMDSSSVGAAGVGGGAGTGGAGGNGALGDGSSGTGCACSTPGMPAESGAMTAGIAIAAAAIGGRRRRARRG